MPILRKGVSLYPSNLLDDDLQEDALSSDGCDVDGHLDEASRRSWWAVYTPSRKEKVLARDLHQEGTPFYLPLIPKYQYISGRHRRSYLPLFNGYLFLYASEHERARAIETSHSRISSMLAVKDEGRFVTDLRRIRGLIESDAPLTVESRLVAGQHVRVKRGVFEGFEGTIIRRNQSTRLLISVDLLQQGVSVEIDDYMVEPV